MALVASRCVMALDSETQIEIRLEDYNEWNIPFSKKVLISTPKDAPISKQDHNIDFPSAYY